MQNPLGARIKDCPFRVRDKVVFRKNLWFKLQADPAQEVYVANGDIGTVDALHKERVTVTFDDRTVLIPKAFWESLELAYAITCHSSQGSQWPVVVALADPSPGAGMTCCREWWTTAWSRASRFLVVIGQRSTIDKHSRTVSLAGRKTFLKERIREWLPRKLTSSAN
jgi:exodeoxyribonuclease V alpha subunit